MTTPWSSDWAQMLEPHHDRVVVEMDKSLPSDEVVAAPEDAHATDCRERGDAAGLDRHRVVTWRSGTP